MGGAGRGQLTVLGGEEFSWGSCESLEQQNPDSNGDSECNAQEASDGNKHCLGKWIKGCFFISFRKLLTFHQAKI